MRFELIVIGTSLGGLHALEKILAGLSSNLPVAVAIAQHRHKSSGSELIPILQQQSSVPVIEAEDKQEIVPQQVYVAPADYHLLVEPGYFTLSTEAPVSYARPSIDVLFESAADAYRQRVMGVILTGANRDGAKGLAKINCFGGLAVVQEPADAESRPMPEAAIAAVPNACILPLAEIAPFLVKQCFSYSVSSGKE